MEGLNMKMRGDSQWNKLVILKIIRMLSYQTLLQQLELPIDNNED
jgi:hypothetical protein